MEKKKETKVGILLLVISVLVLGLGITFAAFTLTSRGNTINQINTGTVTMTYENANNGISISNALPTTDEVGKRLTDTDQYFDFVVSINITGSQSISYEVTAEKIIDASSELESLNNNEVRLYLQRGDNSTTYSDEILEPSYFTPLSEEDSFGAGRSEMVLDQGTVSSTTKYYYRLRMWVDENYEVTDQVKYFTVKVNVYGRDGSISSHESPSGFTGTIYRKSTEVSLNNHSYLGDNANWVIKDGIVYAWFDTQTECETYRTNYELPDELSCIEEAGTYGKLTSYEIGEPKSEWTYYLKHVVENNIITHSYACGVENGREFCLEGGNSSLYPTNVNTLNTVFPSCGADSSRSDANCGGSSVYANADSNGTVYVYGDDGSCGVDGDGGAICILFSEPSETS